MALESEELFEGGCPSRPTVSLDPRILTYGLVSYGAEGYYLVDTSFITSARARMTPTHPQDTRGAGQLAGEPDRGTGEPGAHAASGNPPVDAGSGSASPGKPKLRGVFHAAFAPIALAIGLTITLLAPAGAPRITAAIFAAATVVLFVVSAVYHRGTWGSTGEAVLRRLDHANIFLVIAGTYTPLSALILPKETATVLLTIVWAGAIGGILMRIFWLNAPRWLYVPIYIALGWVAVAFIPAFWTLGGPAVAWLVIAGGLGYTLGAVVYGFKRPNPYPRWFGFHEIFHIGTIIGYSCHAAAITLVVLS